MPVKMIIVLFAAYILILDVYPCSDQEMCGDDHEIIQSLNDNQANNTVDFCSPFCICACCSINFNISSGIDLNVALPNAFTIVSVPYDDKWTSNIHHSIWQPPKI